MAIGLVTGGGRGIGAAAAFTLAAQGYRVVVNHRDSAPQAEDVVASIIGANGEAMAIRADVADANELAALVDEVNRRLSGIDVLMHSALAPYVVSSFNELNWGQLGCKLDTELHRAFLVTKGMVQGMISRSHRRLIRVSALPSRRAREGMITLRPPKRPWTSSCDTSRWSLHRTGSPLTSLQRPRCKVVLRIR